MTLNKANGNIQIGGFTSSSNIQVKACKIKNTTYSYASETVDVVNYTGSSYYSNGSYGIKQTNFTYDIDSDVFYYKEMYEPPENITAPGANSTGHYADLYSKTVTNSDLQNAVRKNIEFVGSGIFTITYSLGKKVSNVIYNDDLSSRITTGTIVGSFNGNDLTFTRQDIVTSQDGRVLTYTTTTVQVFSTIIIWGCVIS